MEFIAKIFDLILLNLIFIFSCVPIITIGAALTAGHDAARRSLAGEGTVTPQLLRRIPIKLRKSNRILADFRHCRVD